VVDFIDVWLLDGADGTTTVIKVATTLALRTMANQGQRFSTVQSLSLPPLFFLGTLQSND
jgi:hypothetical protein